MERVEGDRQAAHTRTASHDQIRIKGKVKSSRYRRKKQRQRRCGGVEKQVIPDSREKRWEVKTFYTRSARYNGFHLLKRMVSRRNVSPCGATDCCANKPMRSVTKTKQHFAQPRLSWQLKFPSIWRDLQDCQPGICVEMKERYSRRFDDSSWSPTSSLIFDWV